LYIRSLGNATPFGAAGTAVGLGKLRGLRAVLRVYFVCYQLAVRLQNGRRASRVGRAGLRTEGLA
jgi:hypothetical protein